MSRADLLALTANDLVLLSNRGIVKRAQREVGDRGGLEITEEEDGTVTVVGPDATTTLVGDRIENAACTCPSTGLCRHVVRAVLAYQDACAASGAPPAAETGWDPGAIGDDALTALVRRAVLVRARGRADSGVAVTLLRSAKPVAHVHDDDVIVRFLVPGDVAYARCSCTGAAPCEHVALAVLAFRALPDEATAGTVELGLRPSVDPEVAEHVERAVALVAEAGVASGREATVQAIEQAAARARDAGWSWPAETLEELAEACRRHAAAEPTFTPVEIPRLVGELLARLDAMAGTAVPHAVVAGGTRRSDVEVRGGLLVGLGTRARRLGTVSHVDALLYDTQNARVVTIGRSLADGERGPLPFGHLAAGIVRRGITYADLGRGQLVATGAKISPGGRLTLGRRPAALSPQRLDWATTLGTLVVDSFAEARALSAQGIPPPLAARTPTNGFAVIAIDGVDDVGWDPAEHAVVGVLRDGSGATATLLHPFTPPGAAGVEALLDGLERAAAVRFVAGYVSASEGGLRLAPTALVVENRTGERTMLQPWVDAVGGVAPAPSVAFDSSDTTLVAELQQALGDLLTAGVGRPDAATRARWADLAAQLDAVGSTLLLGPVRRLNEEMERGLRDTGRGIAAAVAAALELAVMLVMAPDSPVQTHRQ